MKFTPIHSNDRIASIFKQAKSMVKQLPLDEIQQHWDKLVKNITDQMNDALQDQIEMLTLQLKDSEEQLATLQALHANLNLRHQELQARLEGHKIYDMKVVNLESQVGRSEKEIIDLKADLKTQCLNRDHFRALVAEQDAFIKEIKKQVEVYKIEKQKGFDAAMATQAIRLNEENSELIKKNVELQNRNDQLNDQTPRLIEENNKFREQTSRLVEEKRKLTDQVNGYECRGVKTGEMGEYCGGCLGCIQMQTDHALYETSDVLAKTKTELRVYKNINNLQADAMGLLYPIVLKLTDNWFPPKGVDAALSNYSNTCRRIADELGQLTPPTKAVPPPDLKSRPETCCGPTHACCGDVNNVV